MADPKKGTGKKPKGSGRRLYTDENPKDTVGIKFATPTDARKTVAKVEDYAIKLVEWCWQSRVNILNKKRKKKNG